ncbi:Endoplasmic reticulum metallopeptidase 1 [Morella rubra]|uniref:Endoplasmic reticulum metallopeptidase 1 n=1 Tax=Morella rubra TaxID=262757 RepID=A0A6A1WMP1_9ROSI|nr:Endoplasmic reticulum metallopeptidase 1 [Morella rubra]
MASRLSAADATGFKLLLSLAVLYGLLTVLAYSVAHMKFVKPLGMDAPLDRFSEARAVEHVRVLSKEIDGRQCVVQFGMVLLQVDIDETIVNGSFSMMFLGFSITLAYRNHTNILMRISSADSQDTDPSLLLNGHFDSPLGSPGAGDCGSCVASMLEVARLTVDSGWVPPRPVVFLFNGAEELFMLGSHGFMNSHKWRDTVGAFINVEASGIGGLDLVCQSGPGSWASEVYAQSAVYPMANSAAQDIFPVIPGDTDFRMFSKDYGNIPGLDIIFLLGGSFYHTSYDTVERLLPGSIQARGENLFSMIKAFTNSSKLQNAHVRESFASAANKYTDERAVFFDYLTWFMIFYPRRVAVVLHSMPVTIFLTCRSFCIFCLLDCVPGLQFPVTLLEVVVYAIIQWNSFLIVHEFLFYLFPLIGVAYLGFGFLIAFNTRFAHPYLAFMMFVPCSLVGLLIPRIIWRSFPLSQDASVLKTSREALSDEASFWGAFGFYAIFTTAYLLSGMSGGFLTFVLCASMLPAWASFCLSAKSYGCRSLRSTVFYVIPLIPCVAFTVFFSGLLSQFLIEKMGMMGDVPPPYGYFLPDVIVAVIIGVATGWCVGPLIPACGHWLARSSILQFLLHLSVLALALSWQFFPYSMDAPKRFAFQHTFVTADGNRLLDSTYDFAVVDSNSFPFVFKYAPEVAKELHISSEFSFETATLSQRETWVATFPVSFLFSRSLKFPTPSGDVQTQYGSFPHVSIYKPNTISSKGSRRVHLEFSIGSLEEVWVAVLNITGPLSSWSFADNSLPAPITVVSGPPSYICRLSGSSHENWTFWLEASSSEDLRVEVAVLDQKLSDAAKKLKSLFPDWMDVIAYSSFLSSYIF